MIEWLISEYVGLDDLGVVTAWFDKQSRKNARFRKLQRRLETKLDQLRKLGPDLIVDDSGISRHIDKIRISGRLTIRVLIVRGPSGMEVTLIGASVEKDRKLIEPSIERDAIARHEALASGLGRRKEYVYIGP